MNTRPPLSWLLFAGALLAWSCGGPERRPSDTAAADSEDHAHATRDSAAPSATAATAGARAPATMQPMMTAPSQRPAAPSGAVAAAGTSAAIAGASGQGMAAVAGSSGAAAGSSGAAGAGQAIPNTRPIGSSAMSSGPAPKLPEITGECPKFATGDWSFSGLTGVMEVGAKTEGTAPLVFYWPGTDFPASAYTQVGDNNIERVTSEGGLIVSIQGSAEHALDTDCSITGYYSHDFEPIAQIAACAVRDYGVDPRRIYATGCSAGGVTSGCLATRASSFIAAVATNSGGLTSVEEILDPSHVPPVMTMHGGAADFGGLFTTDGRNLNMAIKNAGGFAVNCDHGGGHCAASAELQNAAFEFLWAHPFGVDPEPYATALPMSFPSYCEIY